MHNTVLGILSNCKRFVDQGKVFSALLTDLSIAQKQPFRGVLKKRCSENIQQIYRRPIPSPCDVIGGGEEVGEQEGYSSIRQLFLKSYFARDVFQEIRFSFIL